MWECWLYSLIFTSIVDQLFQKMEPSVLYVFCQCDVTSLAHCITDGPADVSPFFHKYLY